MNGQEAIRMRLRKRTVLAIGLAFIGFAIAAAWLVWFVVPDDLGGLTTVIKPAFPFLALAMIVDSAKYIRGAVVGSITVSPYGIECPWHWTETRRLVPWSKVDSVTITPVSLLGWRSEGLHLRGADQRPLAGIPKHFVDDWDALMSLVDQYTEPT